MNAEALIAAAIHGAKRGPEWLDAVLDSAASADGDGWSDGFGEESSGVVQSARERVQQMAMQYVTNRRGSEDLQEEIRRSKDKLGRNICYDTDARKRVSCGPSAKQAGQGKAGDAVQGAIDHWRRVHQSGKITPTQVDEFAAALNELTVKELGDLKKRMMVRASGRKAEMARKIAERLLADAKPAVKDEPSPAEKEERPAEPPAKQGGSTPMLTDAEAKRKLWDKAEAISRDFDSGDRVSFKDLRRVAHDIPREQFDKAILELQSDGHIQLARVNPDDVSKLTEKDLQSFVRDEQGNYWISATGKKAPPEADWQAKEKKYTFDDSTKSKVVGLAAKLDRDWPRADVSLRDLRDRMPGMDKREFDALIVQMAESGEVQLSRHNFPDTIPDAEREGLVEDGKGNFFVAMRGGENLRQQEPAVATDEQPASKEPEPARAEKKPWEMSKKEYTDALVKRAEGIEADMKGRPSDRKTAKAMGQAIKEMGGIHSEHVKAAKERGEDVPLSVLADHPHLKDPHQMSQEEYNQHGYKQFHSGPSATAKHPMGGTFGERSRRADVERAIRAGKSVPPEVLADYPDLSPESADSATQGEPTHDSVANAALSAGAPRSDVQDVLRAKTPGDKLKALARLDSHFLDRLTDEGVTTHNEVLRSALRAHESGSAEQMTRAAERGEQYASEARKAGHTKVADFYERHAVPFIRELAKGMSGGQQQQAAAPAKKESSPADSPSEASNADSMPRPVNAKWVSQQRAIAQSMADSEDRNALLAEIDSRVEEAARFNDFLTWAESKYGKRNDYEIAGHAPGKALVKGKGPSRKVTPIHVVWQDYQQQAAPPAAPPKKVGNPSAKFAAPSQAKQEVGNLYDAVGQDGFDGKQWVVVLHKLENATRPTLVAAAEGAKMVVPPSMPAKEILRQLVGRIKGRFGANKVTNLLDPVELKKPGEKRTTNEFAAEMDRIWSASQASKASPPKKSAAAAATATATATASAPEKAPAAMQPEPAEASPRPPAGPAGPTPGSDKEPKYATPQAAKQEVGNLYNEVGSDSFNGKQWAHVVRKLEAASRPTLVAAAEGVSMRVPPSMPAKEILRQLLARIKGRYAANKVTNLLDPVELNKPGEKKGSDPFAVELDRAYRAASEGRK